MIINMASVGALRLLLLLLLGAGADPSLTLVRTAAATGSAFLQVRPNL